MLQRGFSRLNIHYEPAVRLAALVLERRSMRHSAGDVSASAFLIDMNRVFEAFLETRLAQALRGRLDVRGQWRTRLDDDGRVAMRPDLVFRDGGQIVFVGDAKYKVTKDLVGVTSDLYQLLAYTAALDLPEGVLVYGHGDEEEPPPTNVDVSNAGRRLHVRRIDLRGPASAITGSVDRLADWIVERSRTPTGCLGTRTIGGVIEKRAARTSNHTDVIVPTPL
ncbi:MAG: McrC family protein [Acidimicrobiia bacterium]|nr:McrC family protein [Acidimicrobiia bacterium]